MTRVNEDRAVQLANFNRGVSAIMSALTNEIIRLGVKQFQLTPVGQSSDLPESISIDLYMDGRRTALSFTQAEVMDAALGTQGMAIAGRILGITAQIAEK